MRMFRGHRKSFIPFLLFLCFVCLATFSHAAGDKDPIVSHFAGFPGDPGSNDGIGAAARFNHPNGITSDGTNLYVVDTGNQTIRKIVISSGVVTTLAGGAGKRGSADGASPSAEFLYPFDITYVDKNRYVTDTSNHTIRKVELLSGKVTTFAGKAGDQAYLDGVGTNARFKNAFLIANDKNYIYVTDTYNNTIRKIELFEK
jgi:sugar lactone lactonase YvrE